uniref:Uncharacterized protein n=1 Tax=Rhizophora mucronata TaxID=61149 RepID=A0A2P2PP02_RHIMU
MLLPKSFFLCLNIFPLV